MKQVRNELKIGVIISYINLIIGSIIPLLYTPIMLRILGQAEYGLYSLAHSAVAYLSLLSFGFGNTILRYSSKYRAEGNKTAEENLFGFFIVLYSFMAILVILCGLYIANEVEFIFHKGLTVSELVKMKSLVLIMAFNSALSFPLSVFTSIISAHEKYFFRKIVDMIFTIAAPVANLVALYLGFASVGMALASTFMQFIMLPINIYYCVKIINIHPKFSKLPKKLIKEMINVSMFHFLASIVDMMFWSTDKVILGMLASSTAVAIYNVGSTFNNMVMNLSTSISGVLAPRITGMVVKNASPSEWTKIFIKVGRIQFVIIGLVVSGFTVFGQTFVQLWVGEEYRLAYWVAILTMFPLCIPLIQNTGLSIVVAQNKHRFRSIVYLIIAIANIISTYLLVPYFGVIGAALCSCISYLIGQGLVMNIYYYKVTGINIPLFWLEIIKMSSVPVIMMIIGGILCDFYTPTNWWTFLMGVIVFSLIYILLMYTFILNDYEKDIFRIPMNKFINFLFSK